VTRASARTSPQIEPLADRAFSPLPFRPRDGALSTLPFCLARFDRMWPVEPTDYRAAQQRFSWTEQLLHWGGADAVVWPRACAWRRHGFV